MRCIFIILFFLISIIYFPPSFLIAQENADNEQIVKDMNNEDVKAVCSKAEYSKMCNELNDEMHKFARAQMIMDEQEDVPSYIEEIVKHFGEKYMGKILPDYKKYQSTYKNWKNFFETSEKLHNKNFSAENYPAALKQYIESRSSGSGSIEAFPQLFLYTGEDMDQLIKDLKRSFPSYNDSQLNELMIVLFEKAFHDKILKDLDLELSKLKDSAENMSKILMQQIKNIYSRQKEASYGGLISETFDIPYDTRKEYITSDVLSEGAVYEITVSGKASCWKDHTDGVDGIYCYGTWRCEKPTNWGIIQIDGKPLTDYDNSLQYNESHVYTIKITGSGQKLKIFPYDGGGYDDNNGSFKVTIAKE